MKTFKEIIQNDEYRERVIKHFRLPIRLSVTLEEFENQLDVIRHVDPEKYAKVVGYTEVDFNAEAERQNTDNPDFTMEYILEEIVEEIENTNEWGKFLEEDYSEVLDNYNGITNIHKFYNKKNHDKYLVSFDLESANWQSLNDILGSDKSYEYLIKERTNRLIPQDSKTFRTKITGMLDARKIMFYNQHLLNKHREDIIKTFNKYIGKDLIKEEEPFAFYADEFIMEINKETFDELKKEDLSLHEENLKDELGIGLHIVPFNLQWLNINKGCAKIYTDGQYDIINVPKDVLSIMTKISYNIPLNLMDFYNIKLTGETVKQYEDRVSKIVKEIKYNKKDE